MNSAALTRPRLIGAALVVALLAAMAFSTTYTTADEVAAGTEQGFDPATFAEEKYASEIVPAITEDPVELTTLVPALREDPEAAGEQYGVREGTSPYSYAVTVTGTAGAVEGGLLPLEVEGLDDVRVSVQIGPAINGTALRDASGLVSFNDFVNQVEYADSAIALNQQMAADLLEGLDVAALEGQQVTVVGATSPLNPDVITVTPVSIEAAS